MYNHHIIRMHIAYLFIVYNKFEIIPSPRPRSNFFHDPDSLSSSTSPSSARNTVFHQIIRAISNLRTHARNHNRNTSGIYAWRRDTARNETNLISSRRLCLHASDTNSSSSFPVFSFFPFSKKNFDSSTIDDSNTCLEGNAFIFIIDSRSIIK